MKVGSWPYSVALGLSIGFVLTGVFSAVVWYQVDDSARAFVATAVAVVGLVSLVAVVYWAKPTS